MEQNRKYDTPDREIELHKQIDDIWKASEGRDAGDAGLRDRIWKRIRWSVLKQELKTFGTAAAAAIFILLSAGLVREAFFAEQEVRIENRMQRPRHITLDDGSEVILNRHSVISYVPSEPRKVKLYGEAFFDITEDSLHPFRVETDSLRVTVLGTRFNVYAYEKDPDVRVSLFSGKVNIGMENGSRQQLRPGEEFVYDFDRLQGGVREFHEKSPIAWTTSSIECSDTPMQELFTKIENYYDIKLHYDARKIVQCRITGTFKIENDISHFFRIIGFSHDIHFRETGPGEYRVIANSCK
ncbi:FecR domain-containing protein [Sinomicrobium kalidii]|uniref:FecR family protein n=1 Tax=Sinomicrobium kalidii TaxID=2900738 RepID=UPI001E5C2197|nr:FecR domain-containing protein [Sinomicrobium kalidii]UGU16459.1 FecR domain-containing protein [Sinomicrobium kalidii]